MAEVEDRVRDLELSDARTRERVADHDRVLVDLRDNLAQMVERARSVEMRVTVLIIFMVLGSPQLRAIGSLVGL